ncbi:MAG TPA: hypothetical protein DCZ92_02485 [Elusimicrobia bacterium]|nr:MAG: hypothetical protein A2016_00270 [Elusimicrobia bacterium GWF2_62_30]HBA59691.1 hypothetical protein [Elusimicrobiota bacterium]
MSELSDSLEDYLEAAWLLGREAGCARACDIGRRLRVSKPSVNSAMKALAARGLIKQERYGSVCLTPRGLKAGAEIAGRHSLLKDFFTSILRLSPAEAEKDACRAEHALGREALRRMGALARFLKSPARKRLLAASGEAVK